MSPDLGYLFARFKVDEFSHTFLGGTVFGVVAGGIVLACYYGLLPVLLKLARRWSGANWPQRAPAPAIPTVVLSLVLGIWTHLILDSFTHAEGWAVLHLPILRSAVAVISGRTLRLCHVLWYVCSSLGIALVVLAAYDWRDRLLGRGATGHGKASRWLDATLAATLILPIEILHHLFRSGLGLLLVATLSMATLLVLGVRFVLPMQIPAAQRI